MAFFRKLKIAKNIYLILFIIIILYIEYFAVNFTKNRTIHSFLLKRGVFIRLKICGMEAVKEQEMKALHLIVTRQLIWIS